jgi:hypothetical protein
VKNRRCSIGAAAKLIPLAVLLGIVYACSQTKNGATATSGQASTALADTAPQGNVVAVGAASVIVVHGQIVAVDQNKKTVTLQADDGKQVTLHA